MAMFGKLFAGGASTVVDSVVGGVKAIWGSAEERDTQRSSEFVSGQNAYAAEFAPRANRTMVDSIADAINRLIRPVIVLHVLAYIWMAILDTEQFQVINVALTLVPEWMRWVITAIISFYFVSRELAKSRDMKMNVDPKAYAAARAEIAGIRSDAAKERALNRPGENAAPGAPQITPAAYDGAMKSDQPLSNAAIEEWNRRKQGGR